MTGLERYIISALRLAALTVLLTACQVPENERSATTEVLLAGAGFKIRKADTPERQVNLETLTQRQIVRHQRSGEALYVYADATSCGCLYAGTKADYERYRDLAQTSRTNGIQRLDAVTSAPGAELDWALWNGVEQRAKSQS